MVKLRQKIKTYSVVCYRIKYLELFGSPCILKIELKLRVYLNKLVSFKSLIHRRPIMINNSLHITHSLKYFNVSQMPAWCGNMENFLRMFSSPAFTLLEHYLQLCNIDSSEWISCGFAGLIVLLSYSSLKVSRCIMWPVSSFIRTDPQCCFVCEWVSEVARCVEFFSRYLLIHFASGKQCSHSQTWAKFLCAHCVISECAD